MDLIANNNDLFVERVTPALVGVFMTDTLDQLESGDDAVVVLN